MARRTSRIFLPRQILCEWCGSPFVYRADETGKNQNGRIRRFCSRQCNLMNANDKRTKLRWEIAEQFYIKSGWSMRRIAEHFGCCQQAVSQAFKKYGVLTRKFTQVSRCKVCGKPAWKRWNPQKRCWYGTRCRFHYRVYTAERKRRVQRVARKIPPERWRILP